MPEAIPARSIETEPVVVLEIVLLSSLSDRNSRAILKTMAAAFREHRNAAPVGTAA